MIRTWTLALAAALAAAAAPMANAGGAAGDTDLKAVLQRLDELKKTVDALSKKVQAIPAEIKLAAIEAEQLKQRLELQSLRAKLESLPGSPSPIGERPGLEEIRHRLGNIEKSLAALQPQTGISERRSFSPPIDGGAGRVRLVNLYGEPMFFIVNGRNYRVEPGTHTIVDFPAGGLSYEVFAERWGIVSPRKMSTLAPNDTLTITAR
jgi:hypothetical protein